MHIQIYLNDRIYLISTDHARSRHWNSKGFAFINFASFEASDAAIEAMNGQHLCNRAITVSYAFKKDSKGERHGSAAGERRREGGVVKQREERKK